MVMQKGLDLCHALADCQRGRGRAIGRQLGDIRSNLPRLFTCEQLCDRSPSWIILVIDVGKRVAVLIPHDDAAVEFFDGPRRWRAERQSHLTTPLSLHPL